MMKFPKLQFKFFNALFFILFLFSFQLWGRSKLDTDLINMDKAIPSVLTSYLNSAGAVSKRQLLLISKNSIWKNHLAFKAVFSNGRNTKKVIINYNSF